MKKLLTIIILCSILFLGCGKALEVSDSKPTIPPLPVLDAEHSIVRVIKVGTFSCIDSDEMAGKVMLFTHTAIKGMVIHKYSMWLFNSNDLVFIEYNEDTTPGRTWIDLGNDKNPEYFAASPTEFKYYPDICKTLDYFRELNGREPRKRELGKTEI